MSEDKNQSNSDLYKRIQELDCRGIHLQDPRLKELIDASNTMYIANHNDYNDPEPKYARKAGCVDSRFEIPSQFKKSSFESQSVYPQWSMSVKKPGDVGMDIPVRIKGMSDIKNEHGKPYLQIYPEIPLNNYNINYQEGYVNIPAGGYGELPSAIHLKMPDDAWAMIRPRSSTGWKRKLVVFEGTIDSSFTGMICCLVHNPNSYDVRIYHNDALAQLVLVPKYPLDTILYVDEAELPETERGQSGFGSTGK